MSSGLTLFISSFSHANKCETLGLVTNYGLTDKLQVEVGIRFPLPDSYIEMLSLNRPNQTEPFYRIKGKDVWHTKSLLAHCLNYDDDCRLKILEKDEREKLNVLFKKIVLC